jgi:hypothetical protein
VLTAVLLVVGIATGVVTDRVMGVDLAQITARCSGLEIHEEHMQNVFCIPLIREQLRQCSLQRGILLIGLVFFVLGLVAGQVGPHEWNWIRVTLLFVSAVGLFIATTVPEHFLEEHLWNHVARQHLPRIVLWTFGTLLALAFGMHYLQIERWIEYSPLAVLLIACLVGLIPESGPHLVFVTLFAEGMIPFSVLLASSIVQDGHGMLPVLAHSRKDFVKVKGISFGVGLAAGVVGYLLRF